MAFGPIMKFQVDGLQVELAPLTKEVMGEFISREYDGGLQRFEVHRYLGRGTAPVLEDEFDWFESARAEKTSFVWGIWVVDGQNRKLIGNTSIFKIGPVGSAGFIRHGVTGSLIFDTNYWGRGIASAAHKARTWFAFKQLGLHRLTSDVLQVNIGSRRALDRAGYVQVGTVRNEAYVDGKLLHLDRLECLNPQTLLWDQWWHEDNPTEEAVAARARTEEVLKWAEENVTF